MLGARITDEVDFFRRRDEKSAAVRAIRRRDPDKFRWRSAVSLLTATAGRLRGSDRMRIEEPVREKVLDIRDSLLKREVVLDARRHNVDLDRGEVLPVRTLGELRRVAFLVGTDLRIVQRYLKLPGDWGEPIDTAGVAVVGRAMADWHRKRAQHLWLQLPDPEGGGDPMMQHHLMMARRAELDADLSRRWAVLAREMLEGSGG